MRKSKWVVHLPQGSGVKINKIRNQHLGNKRYDVSFFGGSMIDSVKLELE